MYSFLHGQKRAVYIADSNEFKCGSFSDEFVQNAIVAHSGWFRLQNSVLGSVFRPFHMDASLEIIALVFLLEFFQLLVHTYDWLHLTSPMFIFRHEPGRMTHTNR